MLPRHRGRVSRPRGGSSRRTCATRGGWRACGPPPGRGGPRPSRSAGCREPGRSAPPQPRPVTPPGSVIANCMPSSEQVSEPTNSPSSHVIGGFGWSISLVSAAVHEPAEQADVHADRHGAQPCVHAGDRVERDKARRSSVPSAASEWPLPMRSVVSSPWTERLIRIWVSPWTMVEVEESGGLAEQSGGSRGGSPGGHELARERAERQAAQHRRDAAGGPAGVAERHLKRQQHGDVGPDEKRLAPAGLRAPAGRSAR